MRLNKTFKILFIFLIISLTMLVFFVTAFAEKVDNNAKVTHLSDGWEYTYSEDASGWKQASLPLRVPTFSNRHLVLLRSKIPFTSHKDPAIKFQTYAQAISVKIDNKEIYHYGVPERGVMKAGLGSAFHVFPIPPDSSGKTIVIESYSPNAILAGYVIDPVIGPITTLQKQITDYPLEVLRQELDYILLFGVFAFLGIILFIVFFIRTVKDQGFFYLGFSSLCFSIWLLSVGNFKLLLLDAPIWWMYISSVSTILLPCGFIIFVGNILTPDKSRLFKVMSLIFLIYAPLSLMLDLTGLLSYSHSIRFFNYMVVISMIVVVLQVIKSAIKGSMEAKILLSGFILISVSGILEIINLYHIKIPLLQGRHILHWGMLIFTILLIILLTRRFIKFYEMTEDYAYEIKENNFNLQKMWEEVKESRDQILKWNKSLEETVLSRTHATKTLLDNAGQGFLTFGSDFIIDPEYSLECIKIFGNPIEGLNFLKLICLDSEQYNYANVIFKKIFGESNPLKAKLYIDMLPSQLDIHNRKISAAYKVVETIPGSGHRKFMAILTDVTETKKLKNQIEKERQAHKLVVKAVSCKPLVLDLLKRYETFTHEDIHTLILGNLPMEQKLFEILRIFHAYKGSFGQMEMHKTVEGISNIETKLMNMKNDHAKYNNENLLEFIEDQKVTTLANDDINTLKSILGPQFFNNSGTIQVDEKMFNSYKEMLEIKVPENLKSQLLPSFVKLRYKPARSLIEPYISYLKKLAEKTGKAVYPLVINGGDFLIDPDVYAGFFNTLVHLFNNAIDHSLESPSVRIRNGKPPMGKIQCNFTQQEEHFVLSIYDDGKGLDFDALRQSAINLNPDNKNLSEENLINMLLTGGLSSKAVPTTISGRGCGISIIKKEAHKLQGTMIIRSINDQGATFEFRFPYVKG